jgi:hypothetical protein
VTGTRPDRTTADARRLCESLHSRLCPPDEFASLGSASTAVVASRLSRYCNSNQEGARIPPPAKAGGPLRAIMMATPVRIPELTEITLKRAVDRRGVHVPAGAHGVVMAAYADGLAYEVEFETPKHVVLTLEGTDIQA